MIYNSHSNLPNIWNCNLAVIGLGYVGLPLAIEFAKDQLCRRTHLKINRDVIGFDISKKRLDELRNNFDTTNEISTEELIKTKLKYSNKKTELVQCEVFIITVPTPIDSSKVPNLNPLLQACRLVGSILEIQNKQGLINTQPVIIFESTVYPGATEEFCVPIIEKESMLKFNVDFFCGYSPERINPGDKKHKLTNIVKVTSGSTEKVKYWVDDLYGSIIESGTYSTSSIKVAEAAKVIENTQRDINIALINELSIIFSKIGIDTLDVLDAANTKWNFLSFKPGLVGGHCIGIDPYYLTYKSQQIGYHPQVVLAGRRVNDEMGRWIVEKIIRQMAIKKIMISGSRALILGFTFKENCPDIRNTKVIDLINELEKYGINVEVTDPLANIELAKNEYNIDITNNIPFHEKYDLVILATSHKHFIEMTLSDWRSITKHFSIIFDLKGLIPREMNAIRP